MCFGVMASGQLEYIHFRMLFDPSGFNPLLTLPCHRLTVSMKLPSSPLPKPERRVGKGPRQNYFNQLYASVAGTYALIFRS